MEGTRLSTKQVKVRKRVVLHHSTGPLAGLKQIIGVLEGTAKQIARDMPVSLRYGTGKTAEHRKTTPRYIEYREFTLAARGRFNDFNPAQV